MCTVTFVPSGNHYFITSNRDESPDRRDLGLVSKHSDEKYTIHYPLDDSSGGSWVAISETGRVVCLLNGAYEPFAYRPPYRMSRGQVVTDMTSANSIDELMHQYELHDIAPFTLLIFEKGKLMQLIWDGNSKEIKELPIDQPHIWSSVTLYPPDVRKQRMQLFDQWINERKMQERESIINFHLTPGTDPANDFVMNRDDIVKTLSVTSIQITADQVSMLHIDLNKPVPEEITVTYAD